MSEIFEKFENEKFIFEDEIPTLFNYICSQLNSYYSPNRNYYEMMYNYCVRLKHVVEWRKKFSYVPVAKLREHICDEKKTLVNYFHDKNHKSCCGLYA